MNNSPATTLSALAALTMLRSALATNGFVWIAVLLSGFVSGVSLPTTATFVSTPVAVGATAATISKEVVAPAARRFEPSPTAQITRLPAGLVQAGLDTNVTPVGNVSVTTTAAAADGPLFVTMIV